MKRLPAIRLLVLSTTALFAAPAGAEAAMTTGQAARALDTSRAGLAQRTGLSAARLDRFMAGSQTVGGLSERQLLVALRHPSLMRSVGVTATSSAMDARAARRYPENGCRRTGAQVTLKSIVGFRLWTFKLSKMWCWDKSRRRVSVRKGSIEPDVDIPQSSAIAGWDYKGLDEGGKSDYYYPYQGSRSRGAHVSYRRGVMKYCPIRIGCSNTRRPKIRLGVRWTGSAWENHGLG